MNSTTTPSTDAPPVNTTVTATWTSGLQFAVQGAGGAAIVIDGARQAGPGPVDTLLGAFAACSAIDVVEYLRRRRTPVEALVVTVDAARRGTPPRRVQRVRLEFRIDGVWIEELHADRAIALSIERYCSIAATLARDVAVSSLLVLNGIPSVPRDHPLAEAVP